MPDPYRNPFHDDNDRNHDSVEWQDETDDDHAHGRMRDGSINMKRLNDLESEFQNDLSSMKEELHEISSRSGGDLEDDDDDASSTERRQRQGSAQFSEPSSNRESITKSTTSAMTQEEEDSIFWANEDATLHNLSDSYTLKDEGDTNEGSSGELLFQTTPHAKKKSAPLINVDDLSGSGGSLTDHQEDEPLMGSGDYKTTPPSNYPSTDDDDFVDDDEEQWEDGDAEPHKDPSFVSDSRGSNKHDDEDSITSDEDNNENENDPQEALPEWRDPQEVLPQWKKESRTRSPETYPPPPEQNNKQRAASNRLSSRMSSRLMQGSSRRSPSTRLQDNSTSSRHNNNLNINNSSRESSRLSTLRLAPKQFSTRHTEYSSDPENESFDPPGGSASPLLLIVDKTPEQISERSSNFYDPDVDGFDEEEEVDPLQSPPPQQQQPPPPLDKNPDHHNNKSSSSSRRNDWSAWAIGMLAILVCCAAIACAIFLPLHFLVWNKQPSDEDTAAQSTMAPTLPFVPILPLYTQQAMQNNSLSPQALAYKWMEQDPNLNQYSPERQLQRFAMATLFYGLRGENWTTTTDNPKFSNRWLSYEDSECSWGTIGESGFSVAGVDGDYCEYNPDTLTSSTGGGGESDNDNAAVAQQAPAAGSSNNNIFGHDNSQQRYLRGGKTRRLQSSNSNNTAASTKNPQIQQLYLPQMNLVGSLPPEIGLLTNLKVVVMDRNSLFGSIPTQVAKLQQLQKLSLAHNFLTGSIPPIQSGSWMSNLRVLDLSHNQLTDKLPPSLAWLSQVEELHLQYNQFQGKMLKSIRAWGPTLRSLQLHNNQFTGSLPNELGMLSKLEVFSMDNNQLTGLLPTQVGGMEKLRELHLFNNDIQGTIPTQIGNLRDLKSLGLVGNQLHGRLPTQLGDLYALETLWLYENALTGPIPQELGWLEGYNMLQHVILYNNSLTGVIPSALCDIAEFQFDCGPDHLCGCGCDWCGDMASNIATPPPTGAPTSPSADDNDSSGGGGDDTDSNPNADGENPADGNGSSTGDMGDFDVGIPDAGNDTDGENAADDTADDSNAGTADPDSGDDVGTADSDNSNATDGNATSPMNTDGTTNTTAPAEEAVVVDDPPDLGLEERYAIRSYTFDWDSAEVTLKYELSDYILDSSVSYILYDGVECRNGANDITKDNQYLFIDMVEPKDDGADLNNEGRGTRDFSIPFVLNRSQITKAPFYRHTGLATGRASFCIGLIVSYNQSDDWKGDVEVNAIESAVQLDINLSDFSRIMDFSTKTVVKPKYF